MLPVGVTFPDEPRGERGDLGVNLSDLFVEGIVSDSYG